MKRKDTNKAKIIAKVNVYKDCKPILNGINWNFYHTLFDTEININPFDTRKHLIYPATYVPEIPFTLIEILTQPGAAVLDPFSGSGTTFFQGLILNRIPFASDICKVSIEYAKSLLILFDRSIDLNNASLRIKKSISKYNYNHDYAVEVKKFNEFTDKLKLWYSKNTFNMLCFFINEQHKSQDTIIKAILNIGLMNIIKTTCCQDRGWGCIADNMIPKKDQIKDKDVFRLLLQKINLLISDVQNRQKYLDKQFDSLYKKITNKSLLFCGDFKEWETLKSNSIDCIITSPPYPNMADYITSQRLSYYYLNSDPDIEKFKETGARFKRARRNSIQAYLNDMLSVNLKMANSLKPGGYICLILPEFEEFNDKKSIRKNVIQKIVDNLEEIGLVKKDVFERILPTMRRSHNIKWASLKKEKIYIYQKQIK
jgi:DNA modification methylase